MSFYITFIDIWAIYSPISQKIGLFLVNGHYLGIYNSAAARALARAQDISADIDPIDLKFSGMIYRDIRARMKLFIRNPLIFF